MVFYQHVAITYRSEEFHSTLIYESYDEAKDKLDWFRTTLQKEFNDGPGHKIEKVEIRKVFPVYTKETKRKMTISDIID